jgi:hypothetical protein
MTKTGAAGHARLLLGVGVGLLALAAGVSLARARLPEWEAHVDAPQQHFAARFLEIAERAGFRAAAGRPRVYLCTRGAESTEPYRWLGDEGPEWLRSTNSAMRVQVIHEVDPGTGGLRRVAAADGRQGRDDQPGRVAPRLPGATRR